jgi:hypothetical protein
MSFPSCMMRLLRGSVYVNAESNPCYARFVPIHIPNKALTPICSPHDDDAAPTPDGAPSPACGGGITSGLSS